MCIIRRMDKHYMVYDNDGILLSNKIEAISTHDDMNKYGHLYILLSVACMILFISINL